MITAMHSSLVLLLALAFTGCGPGIMPASLRHPLEGAAAPRLGELGTAQSKSEAVGIWNGGGTAVKVTVVDFWASWCPGCQESMPALDELYRDKHSAGVDVIGVSVDERSADAYATVAALHTTFPIVVDADARFQTSYRVGQVPLSFVVDRNGTVRWIGRDTVALRRAVEVVLSEGP